MKYLMFMVSIILTTFCFSQSKKAPDVFEPAYVITLKGDSLKGTIKMPKLKKHEIYQKINFKDAKTNKMKMFLPDKIKGYGFGNYYYKSAFYENKPTFFKVLSVGSANLSQICYEVVESGQKLEVVEFWAETTTKNQEMVMLEAKGLKKQLKDIFKSNKELVQKINEQKEIPFNTETLESLFKEFNASPNSNL